LLLCVPLGIALASCRLVSAQSGSPIAPSLPEPPPAQAQAVLLRSGATVSLRIRQVIPADGLSPSERLLNADFHGRKPPHNRTVVR
jgi:hypothetical protein